VDFILTEEQELIRETLRKFVETEYPFARRQEVVASDEAFDRELWRALAELGVLGMPFGSDVGGGAGSGVDDYIAFEALGRGLAAEPALSTIVLGGSLLERAGSDAQRKTLVPEIMRGERVIGVGLFESQSRYNTANVTVEATPADSGWTLRGLKSVVYNAPVADTLLVSARTSGSAMDTSGITLFAIDAAGNGLERRDYATVDGFRASEIELRDVPVTGDSVVGVLGEAWPLIEHAVDRATLAVCAEAVGIMEVLNERTLEHCKTHQAFGQPIGKFQALQHRLVDMHVAYEHAAAITMRAARAMEQDSNRRAAAISAAKFQVAKEANFVGTNAIQLHGAIGMSDELDVGHYFKRLVVIGSLFGDADHHVRRFDERSEWLSTRSPEEVR